MILTIAFILFFMVSRNNQNKMVTEQQLLEADFRRQLLQSQVEVQEATFSSLGKELHDNIGQLLGTAKMLLGVSQRNLATSADTIKTADETLSKAIHELRSLSKTLNKEWLEQFDFKQNLQTEIGRINAAGLMQISVSDRTNKLALTAEEQIILFRIVQEAIQNAVKHSEANSVEIQMSNSDNSLFINIHDNGKGFVIPEHITGVGLMNMKHRTTLLKGDIQWKNMGEGTLVIITLPLELTTL